MIITIINYSRLKIWRYRALLPALLCRRRRQQQQMTINAVSRWQIHMMPCHTQLTISHRKLTILNVFVLWHIRRFQSHLSPMTSVEVPDALATRRCGKSLISIERQRWRHSLRLLSFRGNLRHRRNGFFVGIRHDLTNGVQRNLDCISFDDDDDEWIYY